MLAFVAGGGSAGPVFALAHPQSAETRTAPPPDLKARTGGQVVGFLVRAKNAAEAGRDGDLVWLRDEIAGSLPGSNEQVVTYGVMWGRIDSPWLFSVQGDTSESRDALMIAVVAAARAASGR